MMSSHIEGRPLACGTFASSGTVGGGVNRCVLPAKMSLMSLSLEDRSTLSEAVGPCPSLSV